MDYVKIEKSIKYGASLFLDALYPRRCPVCGLISKKGDVCVSCLGKLSFVTSPACKKCGKELYSKTTEYCLDCTRHRRSFEYGLSLLNYNEAASMSMAAIKYKNKKEYMEYYAKEAWNRLGDRLSAMGAEVIIPVPVHPKRLRKRGFNQAELLAEKLGEELCLPVCPELLRRRKNTEPQKSLTPAQRLKNLEEAFTAEHIPYKSVLLVDDIYTTGSTMEACSRVLRKAGAQKVYFFTVCIGQGQ